MCLCSFSLIYQILTLLVSHSGRWKPPLYFPHPISLLLPVFDIYIIIFKLSLFFNCLGNPNVLKSLVLIPHTLGFPGSSAGKEFACSVGDLGFIPGLGRSPGEGKGYPLQYSGLENSMDCTVNGGHKESDTTEQLSLHLYESSHKL